MRRAILAVLCAGIAAAAGAAHLADAGVIERVRVSDPARRAQGLPPGVILELNSPPDYVRAATGEASGTWTGPQWVDRATGETGAAEMTWRVTFDDRPATDLEQVVARNVRNAGWRRDQRGGLTIDRAVGRKLIAALTGYYYVLTPGGADARIEAVFAFPLEQNLHGIVHLELTSPSRESQAVRGMINGLTWNRGQALVALTATVLRGNLQPKIVGARAYENGRVIRGKVVDRFLDPVVGAQVFLERGSGSRWTRVARAKTNFRGFYRLRPGRRGAYRVTVELAGFSVQSRALLAGRGRR